MSDLTGIDWTDHSFNPWWGCFRVSDECKLCYAAELAASRRGMPELWRGPEHPILEQSDAYWAKPLTWNRASERDVLLRERFPDATEGVGLGRRHRVFCASMADVFEERRDLDPIRHRLFALIAATPHLDWQLLTKRPEFARDWLRTYYEKYWCAVDHAEPYTPLPWTSRDGISWGVHPNVWVGVSIGRRAALGRADVLREIPAPVRFISAEPLLESLIERPREGEKVDREQGTGAVLEDASTLAADRIRPESSSLAGPLDISGIDWLIIGGESGGREARPMHPLWARELRDLVLDRVYDPVCCNEPTMQQVCCGHYLGTGECCGDGVPGDPECCGEPVPAGTRPALFFKQWGSWAPLPTGSSSEGIYVSADGTRHAPLAHEGSLRSFDSEDSVVRMRYRGSTPKAGGKTIDGTEWCEFPDAPPAGVVAPEAGVLF